LTVDEELNLLDDTVRRLKVEYDVYFGGGSKKPPVDTEWRVQSIVKKYSDSQKLNYSQRFRFNAILQKYSVYSDLWRQKLKIKEEGYRRPQDAILGIQGLRHEQEVAAAEALEASAEPELFHVTCSGAADTEAVRTLFEAMMNARRQAGQQAEGASFESFRRFVLRKTEQIRKDYACHSVEYSVEVQDGQVKLKAKAKI
jgi:hypothetical protein